MVVDTLVAHGEGWLAAIGDDPRAAVLDADPAPVATIRPEELDGALAAVADFANLKSPFFRRHSTGVAELAVMAAKAAGLSDADATAIGCAGWSTMWDASGSRAGSGTGPARSTPTSGSVCVSIRTSASGSCIAARCSDPSPSSQAATSNVHRLVLDEPSMGLSYPPGSIKAVERAVVAGDLDRAVVTMFVDILEMTEEQIDAIRASTAPSWATRIAAAHTLPRECRVEESWVYQPAQFDAITAPTLLLAGSDTPADLSEATHAAAAAIPDTRIRVLDGHGHMAHKADPAMVAAIARQFVLSIVGDLLAAGEHRRVSQNVRRSGLAR